MGSFVAGTTTQLATYTNAAGTVQNTNPIVLDAAGGATIWLGQTAYKFVLKDASGGTIWTVDQVVSVTTLGCLGNNAIDHGCTGATTSQGAANNIVNGNTISPAVVTKSDVNGLIVVTAHGVVAGGTLGSGLSTDTANTAAIQAAINLAESTHAQLYFPCGVYNVNSCLTVYGRQSVSLIGQ